MAELVFQNSEGNSIEKIIIVVAVALLALPALADWRYVNNTDAMTDKAHTVQVKNDSGGSTPILACKVLKLVAKEDCFKASK